MSEEYGDAADEHKVKAKAKREERLERKNSDEMRLILSTKEGRRFLWQLVGECGVFQCLFDGNGSRTFFKEGERNVGLKILTRIMDASPDSYVVMSRENKAGDYDC